MFPACRTEGDGFTRPPFALVPRDVAGFLDALQEFQGLFHACFPRSEPRAHFFDSMVGQLSPRERKAIEPIALHVEGGTIRGLQRFMSDVVWDEEQRRWNYHQVVADELGDPDGVLMFDETGLVKKGKDSVGVARPYCGSLGKGEKGQVGCVPGRPRGRAMPWWTRAYSGLKRGGPRRMPSDGRGATSPRSGPFAPHRRWRQRCGGPSRRRDACRSRILWRMAAMARALTFWRP